VQTKYKIGRQGLNPAKCFTCCEDSVSMEVPADVFVSGGLFHRHRAQAQRYTLQIICAT